MLSGILLVIDSKCEAQGKLIWFEHNIEYLWEEEKLPQGIAHVHQNLS